MKRLRAGIIGVGNIGNAHIEAIHRLGYAEVAAICVRDKARAKELCDFFGIQKYFTEYKEMLDDPDIEVVHNCTPNTAHFQINKDCIIAGKHILSEKPLTVYSGESEELLELLKSHNVQNSINFVYRHYSLAQHVKGMIENGELGDIYAIHGTYLQDWLLHESDYNWRVDAKLGGPSRAMADIGSHWCDLAQFLLGQDISEVCADLATFIPFRETGNSGMGLGGRVAVNTEDYASALLRFAKGARGSFTVSQVSAGSKIGLSFGIDGSKASVRWEHGQADRLWIGHRDSPNEELALHPDLLNERGKGSVLYGEKGERWPDAQKNMIDSFYRTILRSEKPRYADFSEGHKITKVVEAILESDRNRSWVKL
jgi:predicted dehydrogenase